MKRFVCAAALLCIGGIAHDNSASSSQPTPAGSSYFLGNDPSKWKMHVRESALAMPLNAAVASYSTYLGGNKDLRPSRMTVDAQGNLYITGSVFWKTAAAWNGETAETSDAFLTKVDPSGQIVYTTYFGGDGNDSVNGIAVDAAGSAYLAGTTWSPNFPTVNAYQSRPGQGMPDAFVCHLDPFGGLVYSTYLGGKLWEFGMAIAVDTKGSAYITGQTASPDFPLTSGAFQTKPLQGDMFRGPYSAFVTKLSPDGKTLVYSTLLGGSRVSCAGGSRCVFVGPQDIGNAIAVDAAGNAYLAGSTNSSDFPTTPGAFQTTCACNYFSSDAFVTKLNPSGSALVFSTYLGGPVPLDNLPGDRATTLAIDAAGNIFVAGYTGSPQFPTTEGAFRRTPDPASTSEGLVVGFVTKLNSAGSGLVYSTLLSEWGMEVANGLRIDERGNAYVTGSSEAPTLPLSAGAFPRGGDFFLKLNAGGSNLLYATLLPDQFARQDVALDPAGGIYLLGSTGYLSRIDGTSFALPPILGVTNAAGGQVTGKIAGGELISLFGTNIGPASPAGLKLNPDGKVSATLAGTQVMIGGLPAPLTYAQKDQINAVVPYLMGSYPSLQILRDGALVGAIQLSAIAADPGVFYLPDPSQPLGTMSLAAALNQDGTINSAEKPSKFGSIVAIYATGFGPMDPTPEDGSVPLQILPQPRMPVRVPAGAPQQELEVLYAGQAPALVAGVMQINFRLPAGQYPTRLLLSLKVGDFESSGFAIYAAP
jgi:uncharacterized protein (TIGR03437 family)